MYVHMFNHIYIYEDRFVKIHIYTYRKIDRYIDIQIDTYVTYI